MVSEDTSLDHLRGKMYGFPKKHVLTCSGVGKCPMTWEYWTSPEKVAI